MSHAATVRAERAAKVAAKREARAESSARYRDRQLAQRDEAQSFLRSLYGVPMAQAADEMLKHHAALGRQGESHRAERAVIAAEYAAVQRVLRWQKRAEFLMSQGIDPTLSNTGVTQVMYHRAGLPQPSLKTLARMQAMENASVAGDYAEDMQAVAEDRLPFRG